MIPFSYGISDSGAISVNVNGKMVVFGKDHPHFNTVLEACRIKDMEAIERVADLPKAIQSYVGTNVEVKGGVVYYKGRTIANSLTRRILKLMADGYPFEPMLLFLNNLMENPSRHAVEELYNFLDNRNLPITEDGCFLAYKSITPDNLDWHTKTIKNEVGTVVSVPRNEVDDNWRTECSSGLHVGAIEYVASFGGSDKKIIIVKVNPKDVVACEGSFQKCRTCEYTIVGEMSEELAASIYNASAAGFSASAPPSSSMSSVSTEDRYPVTEDEEDDDYEEDDYDDEEDDEDSNEF